MTNIDSTMLASNEIEKHIAIICRGMIDCVDRLPYETIQKAHIYTRIAASMMQASQCELADVAARVQAPSS